MMRYPHLFFDLDHTLWDFEANSAQTLRHIYQEFNLQQRGIADFNDFIDHYKTHNDIMWERFRNGFIKREDLRWKRIWHTLLEFDIYDVVLSHEMSATYLEILPTQTVLFPKTKEILNYCKEKGYQMHLITNGFEITQRQKIQFSGIASFFKEIITSEKSMSVKPHAGIFDYAEKITQAVKKECLMIGDALNVDILGARNAGWDQVYFNPGKKPHEEKPTFEITDWTELKDIL